MKQKLIEKDSCPSCNTQFDCSKSKRCWCFEHEVNARTLEKIENEYEGCLCAECLKRIDRDCF